MNTKALGFFLSLVAGPACGEPLPDGEVTYLDGWSAWLNGPTARYEHGALGDYIAAGLDARNQSSLRPKRSA